MREEYTHVTFVLDRSGSMASVRDDTIGGVNRFIEDQKAVEGDCTFTLHQFDNKHEVEYCFSNLKNVVGLDRTTYVPRGCTALYDAIGQQIVETGDRLASIPEDLRPGKVMFVILTDGYENASKTYSLARVKEMIEHQTEKYGWVFMFLGANIDAENVAGSLGVDVDFSSTYTASSNGMERTFDILSEKVGGMRRTAGPLYCMGKKTAIAEAFVYNADEKAQMQQN